MFRSQACNVTILQSFRLLTLVGISFRANFMRGHSASLHHLQSEWIHVVSNFELLSPSEFLPLQSHCFLLSSEVYCCTFQIWSDFTLKFIHVLVLLWLGLWLWFPLAMSPFLWCVRCLCNDIVASVLLLRRGDVPGTLVQFLEEEVVPKAALTSWPHRSEGKLDKSSWPFHRQGGQMPFLFCEKLVQQVFSGYLADACKRVQVTMEHTMDGWVSAEPRASLVQAATHGYRTCAKPTAHFGQGVNHHQHY